MRPAGSRDERVVALTFDDGSSSETRPCSSTCAQATVRRRRSSWSDGGGGHPDVARLVARTAQGWQHTHEHLPAESLAAMRCWTTSSAATLRSSRPGARVHSLHGPRGETTCAASRRSSAAGTHDRALVDPLGRTCAYSARWVARFVGQARTGHRAPHDGGDEPRWIRRSRRVDRAYPAGVFVRLSAAVDEPREVTVFSCTTSCAGCRMRHGQSPKRCGSA